MSRNDAPLHDRIRHLLGRSCETDQDILVTETGKSWVFLTPHHVYKQKKQVRDDLQDLTNLRARYDNTLTEIDLNRRLAPDIYEGAVRVAEDASGALSLNRPGQTVDWLVKMRRLPASRMLDQMVADHHGDEATLGVFVDMLAAVLVEFYRHAPRSNLNTEELLTLLEDQHAQCHAVLLHSKFAAHHARFNAVLDKFDASLGPFFKIFAEGRGGRHRRMSRRSAARAYLSHRPTDHFRLPGIQPKPPATRPLQRDHLSGHGMRPSGRTVDQATANQCPQAEHARSSPRRAVALLRDHPRAFTAAYLSGAFTRCCSSEVREMDAAGAPIP